jgi:pimeloyl-ACP methyl ester carboxylesterase
MKQELGINGHPIFVETAGPLDGPPVVLLHHGLGAIRSWKAQIPVLAEAGFRVLVYDRWGHGKSAPRERWAIPYFRSDLADFEAILDHLNFAQAALVGHSDGGKIAMYYSVEHPQRVTCLVLVSTHIYIEPKMAPGIASVRHDFEHDHSFQSKMRRVHGENADSLFWGWFNGWTNPDIKDWDMRPLIKGIECPTLVVQGLEDEHASPQHAREIVEAVPNAELWLLPDVGHMPAQDRPAEFNQKILLFIRNSQTEETTKFLA